MGSPVFAVFALGMVECALVRLSRTARGVQIHSLGIHLAAEAAVMAAGPQEDMRL